MNAFYHLYLLTMDDKAQSLNCISRYITGSSVPVNRKCSTRFPPLSLKFVSLLPQYKLDLTHCQTTAQTGRYHTDPSLFLGYMKNKNWPLRIFTLLMHLVGIGSLTIKRIFTSKSRLQSRVLTLLAMSPNIIHHRLKTIQSRLALVNTWFTRLVPGFPTIVFIFVIETHCEVLTGANTSEPDHIKTSVAVTVIDSSGTGLVSC